MKLERIRSGPIDTIKLESRVVYDYALIGEIKFHQEATEVFENNVLEYYRMDSKVYIWDYYAETIRQDGVYQIDVDTRASTSKHSLTVPVETTYLWLYFNDPTAVRRIYAENTGTFETFTKARDNVYTVEIGGNVWEITIENGQVIRADYDGWVDFSMRLDKSQSK